MRHLKRTAKLGRKGEHRNAMLANLVCSLIKTKRIRTTLAKARAARPAKRSANGEIGEAPARAPALAPGAPSSVARARPNSCPSDARRAAETPRVAPLWVLAHAPRALAVVAGTQTRAVPFPPSLRRCRQPCRVHLPRKQSARCTSSTRGETPGKPPKLAHAHRARSSAYGQGDSPRTTETVRWKIGAARKVRLGLRLMKRLTEYCKKSDVC